MTEENKMLDFLKKKGIKTLEHLEAIFKPIQDETIGEDVEFVKEITGPSQDKINLLIEASERNKEKILNVLLKTVKGATAETPELLEQKKVVQQSNIVSDPGTVVVPPPAVSVVNAVPTASCPKKNATPLPMRYRHKHTQHINQIRSLQQRENNRQVNAKQANNNNMEFGVNIQYDLFNQCNQNNQLSHHQNYTTSNQHAYKGVRHNIATSYNNANSYNNASCHNYNATGYNNATGYYNAGYNNALGNNNSGYHNRTWVNTKASSGMAKYRETESLLSTPVFNTLLQQQWPTVTPMAHTGQSSCNNFGQFELGSQVQSQQSCAQYMMANRPIFEPN